jgi:uncharacterized protein (DUF2062 family)
MLRAPTMARNFFRKYLPSADEVRANRWIAMFGNTLGHPNLWHLNRDSVAGAVAIGLFAGLVPGPLQMLVAILLAIPLKRNLPVALATTFYTNPFTIVPLYVVAYGYGSLLLGDGLRLPARQPLAMDWSDWLGSFEEIWQWCLALGKPLAFGLPALALTLAALGYFAVQFGWRANVRRRWRARCKARSERAAAA